jgi:hypothetical protein
VQPQLTTPNQGYEEDWNPEGECHKVQPLWQRGLPTRVWRKVAPNYEQRCEDDWTIEREERLQDCKKLRRLPAAENDDRSKEA